MTEKIIKWRSVKKDGLPEKSGKVVICYTYGIMDVSYSAKHKCFFAYDSSPRENLKKSKEISRKVTHWAPFEELIPEEAKDEKAD